MDGASKMGVVSRGELKDVNLLVSACDLTSEEAAEGASEISPETVEYRRVKPELALRADGEGLPVVKESGKVVDGNLIGELRCDIGLVATDFGVDLCVVEGFGRADPSTQLAEEGAGYEVGLDWEIAEGGNLDQIGQVKAGRGERKFEIREATINNDVVPGDALDYLASNEAIGERDVEGTKQSEATLDGGKVGDGVVTFESVSVVVSVVGEGVQFGVEGGGAG